MQKRKLDIGKYTYNAQGVCENPDTVLHFYNKKILYEIKVAQCHAGWLGGYYYGKRGSDVGSGLSSAGVSLNHGVFYNKGLAALEMAERAMKYFTGLKGMNENSKDLKPLRDFIMSMQNPEEPIRYSDADLEFFKSIIHKKLEGANKELEYLRGLIDKGGNGNQMELDQLKQMKERQVTFISHLGAAMLRIDDKTYGICRVTGKLIDKERLTAVPHATLSIEAKMGSHLQQDEIINQPADTISAGKTIKPKKMSTTKPAASVGEELPQKQQNDETVTQSLEKTYTGHSKLETSEETKGRVCRICACTDDNCSMCIKLTGQPCHWVEENLCSACVDAVQNHGGERKDLIQAIEPIIPQVFDPANFFQQLFPLLDGVHLTIRAKRINGALVVEVLPNTAVTMKSVELKGTAEEIDAAFFQHVTGPITAAQGLAVKEKEATVKPKKKSIPKKTAKPAVKKQPAKKAAKPAVKKVAKPVVKKAVKQVVKKTAKPKPEKKAKVEKVVKPAAPDLFAGV